MLDEDPIVVIRQLLLSNWNNSSTGYQDTPRIHTGWYDKGSSRPQITVTNLEEGVVNPGVTGHTAATGDGGVAQVRTGVVHVNCWAGSYSDLEGASPLGEDLSPKELAFEMQQEVYRIIQENGSGTTDSDGNQQLNSLAVDEITRIVDDDATPTVFRNRLTVTFSYVTKV